MALDVWNTPHSPQAKSVRTELVKAWEWKFRCDPNQSSLLGCQGCKTDAFYPWAYISHKLIQSWLSTEVIFSLKFFFSYSISAVFLGDHGHPVPHWKVDFSPLVTRGLPLCLDQGVTIKHFQITPERSLAVEGSSSSSENTPGAPSACLQLKVGPGSVRSLFPPWNSIKPHRRAWEWKQHCRHATGKFKVEF